jgi:hypothetical protein
MSALYPDRSIDPLDTDAEFWRLIQRNYGVTAPVDTPARRLWSELFGGTTPPFDQYGDNDNHSKGL